MPIIRTKSWGLPMVLALSTVLLAACGDGKPPATQVVAKVNKDEITSHQIDYVASRTRMTPENAAQSRKKILDLLVDQQIAVQQAIDRKLDRSPEVIAAIDMAKRDILAKAYFNQLASTVTEPSEAEIKAYYNAHPELFGQRRSFVLQEISVPTDKAPKDLLRQQAATNKPLPEISALLKKENVPHATNAAKVMSEQVPAHVLSKVSQLKDGQNGIVETPQATFLLRVSASQPAPIDEKAAQAPIRKLLMVQKNREAVSRTMADLKQKAQIEYLNEYANTASASAPKPAEPAATQAKPDSNPGLPTVASTAEAGSASVTQPSSESIQSGVKGLR
jgi:EpsD family peptidyl-prolyl cis-trans isomerase